MNSSSGPSIREIFADAAGIGAGVTCMAIAAPFMQQLISGFSDIDLMNLADSLREAPVIFLATGFIAVAYRYTIDRWKTDRASGPNTPEIH